MIRRLTAAFTGCKYGCERDQPNPDCPYVRWLDAVLQGGLERTEGEREAKREAVAK